MGRIGPANRDKLRSGHRGSREVQTEAIDREAFLLAIDALPTLERATFILARADGLSFAEIAFRLGLDASRVENHFAKALSSISATLADRWPLPEA